MMRKAILPGAAVAGVGGLLMAVNPRSVASAFAHFESWTLIPILVLMLGFYALQGLRWHLLLRAAGARVRLVDSQLINFAGQAMTAVVPLGDLTRAMLVSRSSGVDAGAAAATVTVQELTFTLLVVLAAIPALGHLPNGIWLVLVVAGGIAAVITLLSVARLFRVVLRGVRCTPGLRRFAAGVESLQRQTARLLRMPAVGAGAVMDLGRVLAATAALGLVLHGLHVDNLGWWNISLVLAASFVGGALSLLPGGVGANEATVVGTLVILGVNPAVAAAAALLQRLTLTAVPALGGALAYAELRRRRRTVARRTAGDGVPVPQVLVLRAAA
ncbi:MAG TPA: lysylphosphatidylglycerol synthase transmembrane domain-containing protein [Candidatus Dormibacteraeota bacterium]